MGQQGCGAALLHGCRVARLQDYGVAGCGAAGLLGCGVARPWGSGAERL